jgi:hypothetical protein
VKAATEIRLAARRLAASWSALDRDQRIPAALLDGVALLLFELRFDHE